MLKSLVEEMEQIRNTKRNKYSIISSIIIAAALKKTWKNLIILNYNLFSSRYRFLIRKKIMDKPTFGFPTSLNSKNDLNFQYQ